MSAALLLVILGAAAGPSADTCSFRSLRPAYAHNDYYNRRPFLDAVDAGLRGAEVDLFFRSGDLHVGHHPRELSRAATLDHVYLSPMAARLDECGSLLTDGQKFWLFLELKEDDDAAFRELGRQLGAARQLLDEGPIQVVLVGWWPENAPDWPDYLKVQRPFERDRDTVVAGTPPIGLVSVDYSRTLRWNGRGTVPERADRALGRARNLAASLGVPLRVHQVPRSRVVYDWLLGAGVDLIGLKSVADTSRLVPR